MKIHWKDLNGEIRAFGRSVSGPVCTGHWVGWCADLVIIHLEERLVKWKMQLAPGTLWHTVPFV